MTRRLVIRSSTSAAVRRVFDRLEYRTLGSVYCYEGGDEFWRARREPCRRLGLRVARNLIGHLPRSGRSLYVGAGVAELPALVTEVLERGRAVMAHNLRRAEVAVLNRACRGTGVRFNATDAATAGGFYDHIWIVSVLNDPERFPHLAPLSYGRADPVSFDPVEFARERRIVRSIVDRCLPKLRLPGVVTTSAEEVVWIADWCHRHRIPYLVGRRQYPTALVGDPICIMRIGARRKRIRAGC
ncbi:conserved protein of unknown function [Nitrospira japonica]|uniref:Uncharacterized protein n=1 Tax=Nitrospira japonica TaxID=1325564 RepID=A0A1W1I3H2_9BACT|nr:hypothetical protein [Nitrospira japonica]SLM47525.1 conserved protein of unknown function [Nitrospira japonica]